MRWELYPDLRGIWGTTEAIPRPGVAQIVLVVSLIYIVRQDNLCHLAPGRGIHSRLAAASIGNIFAKPLGIFCQDTLSGRGRNIGEVYRLIGYRVAR